MTIYMLYVDGTEAMVFDRDEIEGHDGIFGIEADEWQASPAYTEMAARYDEVKRETALLDSHDNTFGIYQLKSGDALHNHRWLHYNEVEKYNLSIDRENYELIYTASLKDGTTLEDITKAFAMDERPSDFHGHSLSVSDVVVFNRGGEITSYYDDGGPFVPLPSFTGYEKLPKQQNTQVVPETVTPPMTQDYGGISASETKMDIKTGNQISPFDRANASKNEPKNSSNKEKPSVLGFLQESKKTAQEAQNQQKSAPKHDTNREV